MFFSESFKVLAPTWRRVTHFELIFVCDVRVQLPSRVWMFHCPSVIC